MKRIILVIIVLLLALLFKPVNNSQLSPDQKIINEYARSVGQIAEIRQKEGTDIDPRCHTKLLTHDERVQKAIILFHGYTSCPAMYGKLAKKFFDEGYNVYVPLAPYHGLKDKWNSKFSQLTDEQLKNYTDNSVNIAHGLGEELNGFFMSEPI